MDEGGQRLQAIVNAFRVGLGGFQNVDTATKEFIYVLFDAGQLVARLFRRQFELQGLHIGLEKEEFVPEFRFSGFIRVFASEYQFVDENNLKGDLD